MPVQFLTRKCAQCGGKFVASPPSSPKKFCSHHCYVDSRKGKPRTERVPIECQTCGKEFWVPGKERRKRALYCSPKCRGVGFRSESTVPEMADIDRAWLAGLFDGEGTVFYTNGEHNQTLRMAVRMCNEEIILRIHELTNCGSVTYHEPPNKKHSPSWTWVCYTNNARAVLRQMLPWLIVKRQKAAEMLEDSEVEDDKLLGRVSD